MIRANLARISNEVGPKVTIVVATKYVHAAEMAALADAGVEVVGENRLQDLVAKQNAVGDRFRWHFIGHLQSRKARDVSERCELVHSLDSISAARRLSAPALVEVNLAAEETKSGIVPDDRYPGMYRLRPPFPVRPVAKILQEQGHALVIPVKA